MSLSKALPAAVVIWASVIAGAEPITRTAVTMKTGSSAMLVVTILHQASKGIRTSGATIIRLTTLTKMVRPSPGFPVAGFRSALGSENRAENFCRSDDVVEACLRRADFFVGALLLSPLDSSTKYEPSTRRVMGTEQFPADLMALVRCKAADQRLD